MRVVVHVLLDLEYRAFLLHLHAEADIDVLGFEGFLLVVAVVCPEVCFVVSVLDELSRPRVVQVGVDTSFDESGQQFVGEPVFAGKVYHRSCLAVLGDHIQRGNTCCFRHTFVVGAESRSDMYDTCTVLGGYVVACNHAESIGATVGDQVLLLVVIHRLHPREELLVTQANEVFALVTCYNIRLEQVAVGIGGAQFFLICVQTRLGKDDMFAVRCYHFHVINLRAYAERGVRRQRPRRGCPGYEVCRRIS